MMPSSRPPMNASASSASLSSSSKPKPILEIIPENRFIVFHGSEHEASSVTLRGVVRLTTPESMTICRPRVRLEGKRKIAWWYTTGLGAGEVADKRVFWREEQKIGVESAHKIKAGVMEWPFEFELAPAMPESVEGLRESYIAYHLHASVARPGWNTKGLAAQEHIRIVRTLGPDSMGMTRSRINADIWANKISYSISIPTDAVVFGTSITADVELSPLRKGLKMGKVELKLVETVVKRIHVTDVPETRADRMKTDELEVAKNHMEFPEHAKVMYDSETVDDPVLADEMYKFKATLPLPKSLNLCRQDVDSHQISITHRFKLMVNIHNPEGHISQLVCKLPVKLFISPSLPVDESNRVQPGASGLTDEALNSTDAVAIAPPQYGQHQLDQIFSDVDTAGYLSRAGSNPGTPAGFHSRSRRASHENLASLNGLANSDISTSPPSSLEHHGSATPSILRSRLAALQERNSNHPLNRPPQNISFAIPTSDTSTPPPGRDTDHDDQTASSSSIPSTSYFPQQSTTGHLTTTSGGENSTASSAPRSRRGSASTPTEHSMHTSDYNMSDLARVPSYGAALRSSGAVTPFTEGPPSYMEATSRPPSPGATGAASTSAPSHPSYFGSSSSSSPPITGPSLLSGSPRGGGGFLTRPSRAHVRAGHGGSASDLQRLAEHQAAGVSVGIGGSAPLPIRSAAAAATGPLPPQMETQQMLLQREEEARLRMLRAQT